MSNQVFEHELLCGALENRFVDCDVVFDFVDGDNQREVSDHLRQGAREAKAVHVAPVAKVDFGLDWTTRTGAREIAMDQEPALRVEVKFLGDTVAGCGFNQVDLAVAFFNFA